MDNINTDDLLGTELLSSDIMNLSPGDLHGSEQSFHSQDFKVLSNYNYTSQAINHIDPAHWNLLPMLEDFETPWDFGIDLNSENSGKTSWMFSTKLNKVFVKINSHFNIYPKYEVQNRGEELFLRCMIVYTSPNEINEPVSKCPNHRDQAKRENIDKPEHILRCSTKDTAYVGKEDGKLFRDKLAIVIPMKNVAVNEPIKLSFTCQNSCSSGMNRKATSLVFTLENVYGELFGRHVLHFKVCSCPKRDKDKDEKETKTVKLMPKKRKLESTAPSTSKKIAFTPSTLIKQESNLSINEVNNTHSTVVKNEQDSVELRLILPNPEIKQQVLNQTINLLAGAMMLNNDVNYENYISNLKSLLDKN